jgi:hypothetical protein
MPTKTITQRAQGYSSQPVTVTVQIDGATILQGVVPTLDTPPPQMPEFWTPNFGGNAWSWTVDSSFDGTQTMTVSVDNGVMYLCDTFYTLSDDQTGNVYHLKFLQQQGNVQFTDPFTAVTINGIDTTPVRTEDSAGQWIYQLTAGDQFACNVNIVPTPPTETP